MNPVLLRVVAVVGVFAASAFGASEDGVDPGWHAAFARAPDDARRAAQHFQAGMDRHAAGDAAGAAASFERAARQAWEVGDAHLNRGVALEAAGRLRAAAAVYAQAARRRGCGTCAEKAGRARCNLLLRVIEQSSVLSSSSTAAPQDGNGWATAAAAVEACEAAVEARTASRGGDDLFSLATAHAQGGWHEAALEWFARGMDELNGDEGGGGGSSHRPAITDASEAHILNYANTLLRAGRPAPALAAARVVLEARNVSAANLLVATILATSEPASSASLAHSVLGLRQHLREEGGARTLVFVPFDCTDDARGGSLLALLADGAGGGGVGRRAGVSAEVVSSGGATYGVQHEAYSLQNPPAGEGGDGVGGSGSGSDYEHPVGMHREKSVRVVTYEKHCLVGPSAVMVSDGGIYTGDHLFEASIVEDVPTWVLQQDADARHQQQQQRQQRVHHGYAVASIVQLKATNHYHLVVETMARLAALHAAGALEGGDKGGRPRLLLPAPSVAPLAEEAVRLVLRGLGAAAVPELVAWPPAEEAGGHRDAAHLHCFARIHTVFALAADAGAEQTEGQAAGGAGDPWDVYVPAAVFLRSLRAAYAAALPPAVAPRGGAASSSAATAAAAPYILYVSRRGRSARQVSADAEERIVAGLDGVAGLGVRIHDGGDCLTEQLTLFAGAAVVVGPHGAGLANTVATREGTPVVLFPMEPACDAVWSKLSAALSNPLWVVPSVGAFYYTPYRVTDAGVAEVVRTVRAALQHRRRTEECRRSDEDAARG